MELCKAIDEHVENWVFCRWQMQRKRLACVYVGFRTVRYTQNFIYFGFFDNDKAIIASENISLQKIESIRI